MLASQTFQRTAKFIIVGFVQSGLHEGNVRLAKVDKLNKILKNLLWLMSMEKSMVNG